MSSLFIEEIVVAKGHYGSERAVLAFRISNCNSTEPCSTTISMDRGTIADIVAWKQN